MEWNRKEFNKEKHQFRSYYCAGCRQRKPCQLLTGWDSKWQSYCCPCYYKNEQEKAKEYSSYELIYQQKVREKKEHDKQLLLLKDYLGCKDCGSKEVDAYSLYENSQLTCQPCRMRKEGGGSHPISFTESSKWHKKHWKINLTEWLTKFQCLPVNASCAKKWLKDRNHLNNCQCLEIEVRKLVELFTSSLKEYQEKLKECKCEVSNKTRTPYYDWANYGYTYCEKCEATIKGAGKHGIIKNRNNPSFWGLSIKEKVLCGLCLESKKGEMPPLRKAEFNRYRKTGRL